MRDPEEGRCVKIEICLIQSHLIDVFLLIIISAALFSPVAKVYS